MLSELSNITFIMQLVGVIAIGSFAGELRRHTSVVDPVFNSLHFFSSILGGAFLSFLVAYAIWVYRGDVNASFLIGGFLAYQNEEYVAKLAKGIFNKFVNSGNGKGGGGGGEHGTST